jgi:hypothetical protein
MTFHELFAVDKAIGNRLVREHCKQSLDYMFITDERYCLLFLCSSQEVIDVDFGPETLECPENRNVLRHLLLSLPNLRVLRLVSALRPVLSRPFPLFAVASKHLISVEMTSMPFMIDLQGQALESVELTDMPIKDAQFVRMPLSQVSYLKLEKCHSVTNSALTHIAEHCAKLTELQVIGANSMGYCREEFYAILNSNPGLEGVGLESRCTITLDNEHHH